MFCLRSWVPLLVFLTNAAPIYVLLFLTATYALQRPCVYCSILLFILVCTLFDFNADWFEPRWTISSGATTTTSQAWSSAFNGNSTIRAAVSETAGLAFSALNETGASIASAVIETIKSRTGENTSTVEATGWEWFRNMLDKRQFRIPCIDVLVRL